MENKKSFKPMAELCLFLIAAAATPGTFPRSDTVCKKWGNVAMGFGIVGVEEMPVSPSSLSL